ncbi:hypothetical protein HMN09_00332500 [Mycena chlorophos]|uniref:Uncharacterized protein n=1 Tax=Mycena chlorophos TaxID=658473 RepID=A0A8H6TIL0_MYCCL|nr:hypothetical protein HMN09_00332500 [Mycena chlorophos]
MYGIQQLDHQRDCEYELALSCLPNSTNVGSIPQTSSANSTNRRIVRRPAGSMFDKDHSDDSIRRNLRVRRQDGHAFGSSGNSQATPEPAGNNMTFMFEVRLLRSPDRARPISFCKGDRIVLSGTTVSPSSNSNSTFELTIDSDQPTTFSNAYSATLNGNQSVEGQQLFYAELNNTNHTATIRVVRPSAKTPAEAFSMEWRAIEKQGGSFTMDTAAAPLPSTATITVSSSASPTLINSPAIGGTSNNPFDSDHMVEIIVPSILGFVLVLALGYILYLRLARRRRRRLADDSPADSQTDPEEPTNIPVDMSERPDSSLAFWEHTQAPNDFAVIERTGTGTSSPGPGALVAVIPSDQRVESRFYEPLHWMGSSTSAYASASLPVSEHDEALSRRTSMSHPVSTVTTSSADTDKTMTNVYGYSKTATDSSKSRSSDSMYSEGSFGGQVTDKQLGRRNSQLSEHSQSDQSSVNTVYAM